MTTGWFLSTLLPSTQTPCISTCHHPSAPCTLLHFHPLRQSGVGSCTAVMSDSVERFRIVDAVCPVPVVVISNAPI